MLITITRVEGPSAACGKLERFDTFQAANTRLFSMSTTAPKDGYDKCDFTIVHDLIGLKYEGRYDLKHYSVEAPDLKGHVVGFLRFMSGTAKPYHMNQESYDRFIKQQGASQARIQEYLDTADWLEKQP